MQRALHQEGAGMGKRIWMSIYRAVVPNILGTRDSCSVPNRPPTGPRPGDWGWEAGKDFRKGAGRLNL